MVSNVTGQNCHELFIHRYMNGRFRATFLGQISCGLISTECLIPPECSSGSLHLRLEEVAFPAPNVPNVQRIVDEFSQSLNTSSYEVFF